MANEQTVKIPISLEVIDSSVQNIKDILGKMKPDSAGFKQLSKIMDDLVKSSGKIQASFERGFSSNSEIKAAEKEIRNVEAAMESLNKLSGSITFKDLKLDDSQQKTFTKLEQDLNIAKQHYNDLLKSFGSKENSALIQLVDKDLALRSFDEIQTALTSKIHEMESSAQGLQTIFTKLSEQVNKITEAQKNGSYKQGDAIKNIIGEDAYKDYFLDTKRGLAFNGTKFTGKGGAKSAFIEYLKQSFTLTDADLADIRNATSAKDLERIFSDENLIAEFSNKISANLGNENNLVGQLKNLLSQVNSVGSEMSGAGTALDAFKEQIMSSANVSPELAQALTLVTQKMQELRGQTGAAGTQLQQFNKQAQMIDQIKGMADRFLGLYQIIGFIKKGFREMTTTIKELDTVMNGISIVTNMSTSDLWNQVDVYSQMAQQYGTSIKGAYEVSRIYYQQGLETRDVMTLTEETLKLSKISGLDYATTTDYMTTALRGFKMEMTDASKVVDVYSNLAANTAVSQQELAEAMTRTASSMESVGATFEETSAMIATMVAVTRESASNIGSAMKSIASRYGELTKDPTKLIDEEGEQMDFNKVDTALRSIGISMHTADGQFRDFTEVILELADAWKTLDSTQQRYVATQFAGNRQQSRFLALVSNGDLLRQNLQVAENSEDVGTTQALKALDSIETKITQVTNAWQQFYLNIGLEDVWKGALTGITNILDTLNEMPKVLNKIPVVAIGIIANSISLIRTLINGGITQISGFIVNRGQSTGVQTGQAMGEGMIKAFEPFLRAIADKLGMELPAALTGSVSGTEQLNNSMSNVANITRMAASAVSMLGLALNDGTRPAEELSGWITGLAGGAQALVGLFLTLNGGPQFGIPLMLSSISSIAAGAGLIIETIEEKVERLTKEAETLSNTAKQLKTDEKNAQTLIDKYYQLEKTRYDSEEAAQEFQNIVNEIADTFPDLINGFDGLGNATIEATQLEETLAAVRRKTAQATLEAAQKEREKAEADAEQAQKNLKDAQQSLTGANTQVQSESYWSQKILTPMANYLDTKPGVKNLINSTVEARNDDARLRLLIDKGYSNFGYNPKLKLFEEAGGGVSGAKAVLDTLSETDSFRQILESYINYYGDSSNSLKELSTQLTNAMSQGDTAQAFKVAQQFRKAYTSATESEQNWYSTLYEKINTWQEASLTLDQANTELQSANLAEVSALAGTALTDFTYTEQQLYSGLTSLATSNLLSMFKSANTDQTPEEWYKALGDNNPMEQIKNLIPELISQGFNFEEFNKVLLDTKHYGSPEELKNALKLNDEEFGILQGMLQTYYENIGTSYKNQASGAIKQAEAKRTSERQGFFTNFGEIVAESNDQVNSYLEQSAINGLLEYEKVIVKTASGKELEKAGTAAMKVVEQIDQVEKGIADQILSNGFSREGLQKSIKALQATEAYANEDSMERSLAKNLEFLYSLLPDNISLTIQSQIDSASQVIDDITGYASKAVSGVSSMEDAQKMIAFFKSYLPDENIGINNLQYSNKKFTLSNAKELLPKLIDAAKNKLAADNKVLSDVDKQIGENNSNINTFINKLQNDDAEAKRVLASIDQGLYNEYFDDQGKLKEGVSFDEKHIVDAVKERREEAAQLEKNTGFLDILLEDIEAEAATVGSVMKEIAANPTKISRDTAGKLKGLNEKLYKLLTEDIYGNYFIAYADLIEALKNNDEIKNSMSLSDRNALINQTKEAQRKASRQSAIENIAENFDAVTGDMLVAWANAVGVDINEIQGKLFTQNGKGYWEYNNGDVQAFLAAEGLADSEVAQKAIGDSLINQEKAVKDFYSSMIASITKGEQRIEKNARTEAIVNDLTKSGYDIVEQYGYYIVNLSKNSIQSLIAQVTNDSTLADADRTELLTSLNNTLKTYSFQEIFTDTLTNYAALTYEQADKLVKGMSNELGVETSLDKLIEEGILSYNTFTGTYEANLDKLIALYDTLEQLGIDQNQDAANTIRAKILQLQHDTSWTTVVENFISSSGSITYEMIGQLLNAALDNGIEGLDFDTVRSYLTSNGKAFDIKDTDLKGLLEKFGIEDDKQTKIIKDAFNARINSLVSGYSNLSQQLTSGFSDFSQMQSIVDDLKAAGYDIDFESIFRYSDALHSWVYTQTGILTRIAQLDTQLESIVDKDSQAYKLLERQRDTLIHQQAQSIDILSVVSATTKEGRDQKRGELLEQVKAYNAVVTDEGKKVTAEQLNAIFDGNVAALKEVYSNLDREVTLDDIRTVANAKYQDLLNAESELDAKVGDIVSERAARIMELSGYAVIDKSTQRVTKIDTSKGKQQWLLYQRELYTAGLASLEDLNKSIVEAWGEMYNIGDKSQTLIGALQNANAMSISDLASLVGLSDKQMSAAFLSSQVGKGNISRIGGDQIRINNWNNFMQELFTNYDKAFDTTSEAYISAYSEYLDGQIEQQTKINEQATSLISTLESATAGDLINVFQLDQAIGGNKIAKAAQQAGAQFENGIIKTVNSTDMQRLMSNIAELLFGEGLVNSKELAQIRSKIDTKTTASTAFANIVQSWDNISYEMINTLAEAMQVDILDLLKLFKSNGHGGYQARGNLGPQSFAAYLGIELDNYSQRIVDNWINTQVENIKTVANSFVSSISNGKQRINVTDENAELVTLLDEEYDEISKDVGGYFIDLTNVGIGRALQMLEKLGLEGNELSEYRNQVFSAFREKSAGNILSQLISNRENLDSTLVDKVIADQALGLTQEIFTYNELTGELSISLASLRAALQKVNNNNNIDSKAYNTLLAQLNQAEFDSTTGIYQQIFTSSTISEDLMAKFINAAGEKLQDVDLDQIFRYKDGSYQIRDFAKARELVDTLGLGLDQVIADVFTQRLQGFYQNIGNIGSQMANGFSNYSDVLAIVNDFNKNFTLDGSLLEANQIATYDEQLHSWVLTQQGISIQLEAVKKQLKDSGASQEEINDALKQTVAQFGESLDFSGYIAATSSTTAEAAQAQANFYQQVIRYNQAITAISGEAEKKITKDDLTAIVHGGTAAVTALEKIYKNLHRTLTQEDITTAYQGPMASVIAAKEAMQASVGGIITTAAATLLQTAGYLTTEDLGNGYSIIKSIDQSNAKNAYDLLYNRALASGVAQQDQLNELILSSWEAADQGESAAIEALGKTAGMSYKEFTDLLLSQGIELGFNTLNDYIASGAIKKIGNGQIRITDINQIVSKEYNSEEYQKAYSEFIDNEIERASEARENVTNTIDEILNAKTGDQINLNSILSKFGEKTQSALRAIIGSDIENGVLTINENSNILQIASSIAEAARAQGTLLESDIVELGDKIREAIQNYIDAITQGITGGISGSQVADIKKFADIYLGKDFFKQSDFIETAKGFQLTSDAAIRYYQALKETGSYDTSEMFTQLQDRILSRDNIDTMSGIVGHIKELGKQIDEANALAASSEGAKAKAAEQTAAALRDELNLYKEIASTSQINNPSSYDFMGKALPDQFQGPINYWNSLQSMATVFQESSKSGKMGVQDFYNIATELGHLSELTGQELMFYGQSFGKGAEGAAKLIEQGFSNLEQVDGSGAMINLEGIGVNIASGISDMSDGIDKGIHEMAQSQIKMLDGLIAFLETIVAMQDLGSLDSDFSGDFSFDEIFTEVNTGIAEANDQAEKLGKTLLTKIDKDEKLKTQFEQVKVGDQSLYQIITDIAAGKPIDKSLAEQYTQILSGLYQASRSQDFTVDNIPSILSQYLINLDTKVEWADGTVTYYYHGKTYNGDKNTDFSKLIREDNIKELQKDLTGRDNIEVEQIEDKFSIKLKNNVQYIIEVGDKGQIIATDENGHSYTGDSFADIQQQIISAYTAKNTGKSGKQAAIELGFEVATNIVWTEDAKKTVDQFSEYTRNMIAKEFKGKKNADEVVASLQAEWDKDSNAFEAKYGFKFDKSLNPDQIHKVLEELVHQQEVELNIAEIPGTDIHIIGPVPVTLEVKDVLGMPKELPYVVGGSVGQNSAAYKQYLSSGDTDILAQIMKAGGVTEAHNFLTNTNGYKAAVLKEAGITNDQILEEAKSLMNGDTPMSLVAAFDQAVDNLYNAKTSVSKEETGEEKGTTATTKNQDTVNQFVDMAAKDAKIYTKELTQSAVDKLWTQANQQALLDSRASSPTAQQAIANEIFDKLIRSALQEKYEKEIEEKQKVEEEKTEKALHEAATANFSKLTNQTGYDAFIKSPEGKAALTAAGQAASQAGANGSTEYIQKWTSEVQSAFDAWSAPENQAKIVAESVSNTATTVETAGQTVQTAAEKAADGLEEVAEAAGVLAPAKETNKETQDNTQEQKEQKQYNKEQLEFFSNYSRYLGPNADTSLLTYNKTLQDKFIQDYKNAQIGDYSEYFDILNDATSQFAALSEGLSGIIGPVTDISSALDGLSSAASGAKKPLDALSSSINNLPKNTKVNVGVDLNGSPVSGTTNVNIHVKAGGGDTTTNEPQATGNVALAAGTRTLMGELGPELVVSNGHYFIAGQNGAEFVDLADDAIVFNHLQTQSLLANGHSGRGKAFTNERKATSMATGNISGPAKASASAVLAQLRQIRAQWESLANLSLVDLAKKGGGGGGGGSDKVIPGFMREVERWYNWLQKIADLEKQITYQEKLRSKIQSDMVSNGKAYYASQRKTYEDARASALTSESLFLQQKEYFNIRRQMLSDAPISSIYTFDESGQAHYKDEEAREWMEKLFTSDKYGQMALTPKQQYQMILARNPALADYMKYDKEGKEIKKSDYKQIDEYYLAMVEAFSDRLTSEQEEMQELFDSWNDQQQAVLEQMQAMNEQLQAMKDNQKEVENAVLDAIVELREREIQAMEDTRDAIEQTNEDFIDGLNKSLEKERQMYEDTQRDQELERNRRQLAILKRSGAPASQIAQLQDKIDQQARDQYFEKQQEQIDAVKEASDLQLEKLDTQIELAQEQLEYEKANGLLWGQVYQVMSGSANDIANFIKGNTEEWWSKSPLTSADDANKIIFQAEQWKAFSEDTDMQNASLGKINQNLDIFMGAMKEIYGKDVKWDEIEKTAQTKYEALFGPNNDDPGSTAWQAYQSATELATTKPAISTTSEKTNTTTATTTGGGKNGKEKAWSYNNDYHYHKLWRNGSWSMADKAAHDFQTTSKKDADGVFNGKKVEYYTVTKKCKICGYTTTEKDIREAKNINTAATVIDQRSINKTGNGTNTLSPGARILQAYASGGKNEYTGLAILHGTSSEPEGILNAEDYKAWKQDIKTTNLLYGALANVSAVQRSTAAAIGSTTNNETGINIENAVVNMNTTIANDYDARRAGEQALEQMLTIARKSGTRSAQRR